ncbi:mannose-1-phosphate guanylyltransferase [Flaviflexus huanghaiensis]|uniref:mannose-1-phosphate guanylyltransferase n=1 Tax=Flaviflexus huanghaiensis TaxID=1111473 RepID=UPI0015FBC3D3|nr:mannose-1-phosphate guanylyltransferase [Flaviflexus huanghaiensis]
MTFVAIVPAGGAGTRLWPLSRRSHPKFLIDMTGGGRTLIQATADRLSPLADDLIVVTGAAHADGVADQLGISTDDLVIEPSPRGTMPAIGLVAAIVEHRHGGHAVIGSFAADHVINDVDAFHGAVRRAIQAAEAGFVVTVGITPTSPDTGFGYIRQGAETAVDGVFAVEAFLEKPDRETAAAYVASGGYTWNAGMFIARAGVLLDALASFKPDLADALRRIASHWDGPDRADALSAWDSLESCVIDRAIAEPLAAQGGVATVPVAMGWSDIGGYDSLAAHLAEPESGVSPGGAPQRVVLRDSADSVVYVHDRPIVIHGVPGAVVVDSGDVILVTTRDASSGLGGVIADLSGDLEPLR